MRSKLTLAVLMFVFVACSPAAAVPTETPTQPPTETPTLTNTPGATATATIIRLPTQDFTLPTFTPFVLQVDGNTVTPAPTPTSSRPGAGFEELTYSPSRIYWGGCEPNAVNITVLVEDPDEVFSVIIFTRVKDFKDEDFTPWTSGAVMLNRGQGEFTYKMVGTKIPGYNHYARSWVYFQLVATNIKGEEIGRSKIYEKAFNMSPCPCLTPLTGCPITPIPTKKP